MKTTKPIVERRAEQPYVGVRDTVTMQTLDAAIPEFLGRTARWLDDHQVQASGAPLIRYHTIDMDNGLDVTIGFPVAATTGSDGAIVADILPEGDYASLIFTGVENGIQGNAALIGWIADQGLVMDQWDTDAGDAFGGRVEFLLDGPEDDPDPANWRSEVAIKLAD